MAVELGRYGLLRLKILELGEVDKGLKTYAPRLYASKLTKKTYVLLLFLLLCASTFNLRADAASSGQSLSVKMSREVELSGYGYLLVNDSVTFINNSTTPLSLPSFTLLYPTEALDYQPLSPLRKDWVKVDRVGNVTSIAVAADLTIPQTSNLTLGIRAILGGLVKPLDGGIYEVAVPTPSSPDTMLREAVIQIYLPADIKPQRIPEGFEQRQSTKGEVLYSALMGIQPTSDLSTTKLTVNASSYSLTVLTVDKQERLVKVISPSEAVIADTLYLRNEGRGTLYSLKIDVDERVSSATLVREDIPLREQKKVSILGSSLDFYTLINSDFKAGEKLTFAISYPLTTKSTTSGNTLLLRIPVKPLVKDALVREYHLTIQAPAGYMLSDTASLNFIYASTLNSEEVNVPVRIGVAWASSNAFPVATLIFLTTFITLSAYIAYRKEAGEQPLLELVRLYENALQSQEAIAEEVAAGSIERVRAAQIDLFAQQLKEIRAKTASKASQIRGRIPSDPKVEQRLMQLNSFDKAYERALLDLLSAYRSYLGGKMKREAFEKTVVDRTRSLQKLTYSIREVLDELSRM